MTYFYGVIFILIGLMLAFKFHKENKIFIPLGIYFLILGGWWIADAATGDEVSMFGGTPGWIFRGISMAALIMCGIFYYKNHFFRGQSTEEEIEEARKKESKDKSGQF